MKDSGKTHKSVDSPIEENPSEQTSQESVREKDTVQIFKEIMDDISIVTSQIGSYDIRTKYKTRLKANIGFIACMLKSYEDRYGK